MRRTPLISVETPVLLLLSQLIAIDSVFPHEQLLADFLERYLCKLGFRVDRVVAEPGRENLIATIGESDAYVCLYGHMDTVAVHPNWQQNPFSITTGKGIARGLGVADMKGGIACILQAAAFASREHLSLKIAFGVDEENISLGSHTLIQTHFFDDIACIISAESGQITDESQDFSVNYGRNGRFVIDVKVQGRMAHAARSDLAINAITEAARLVGLLEHLSLPKHKHLGSVQIIPFSIAAETNAFSIPEEAQLLFNVLSVPGLTSTQMIRLCTQATKQAGIQAFFTLQPRATAYMEAYEVDREDPTILRLENEVFSHYHTQPTYARSVADENRFFHAFHIPVISMGPIGGNDHVANEWVRISSLDTTAQAYMKIVNMFNSLEPRLYPLTISG